MGFLLAFSWFAIAAGFLVNNGPKTYRSVFRRSTELSKKSNLFRAFVELLHFSTWFGYLSIFYSALHASWHLYKRLLSPLAGRKVRKNRRKWWLGGKIMLKRILKRFWNVFWNGSEMVKSRRTMPICQSTKMRKRWFLFQTFLSDYLPNYLLYTELCCLLFR